MGIVQLKKIEEVLRRKEKIAQRYNQAFESTKNIRPPFVPEYVTRHAWYMYAVSVGNKDREAIVKKLGKKGIETRLSFPPIHAQPLYKKLFNYKEDSFPITYEAWKKLIDIPIWAGLKKKEQDRVISALIDSCEK